MTIIKYTEIGLQFMLSFRGSLTFINILRLYKACVVQEGGGGGCVKNDNINAV